MVFTRDQAVAFLRQYNKEPFHLRHAFTVEAVMDWFAVDQGYEGEREFWAMAGLLHDVDYEMWPDEHCHKCQELMKDAGLEPELIHAVASHGYTHCCDVEPVHTMEKVLFACDELTGLIGAAALMRPSKSCVDMELKSLKKKFKDKKFAAGCSREIIQQGADQLGWDLDTLLEKALLAMQATEDVINNECANLGA